MPFMKMVSWCNVWSEDQFGTVSSLFAGVGKKRDKATLNKKARYLNSRYPLAYEVAAPVFIRKYHVIMEYSIPWITALALIDYAQVYINF